MKQPFVIAWLLLAVCPGVLYAAEPPVQWLENKGNQIIWKGVSGEFAVLWASNDILAWNVKNTTPAGVFSLRADSHREFNLIATETWESFGADNTLEVYERNLAILSLVGPILSVEDHFYASMAMEAHPNGQTRFITYDLQKGAPALLTDYFAADVVFAALRQDPLIKRALGEAKPTSLQELAEQFAHEPPPNDACYAVDMDWIHHFMFYQVEKSKVAVRIGLPGAGPCRESLTQIGIWLPISAELQSAMQQAADGKQGFLAAQQKKLANGKRTTLEFTAPTLKKP